jgi:hypothetical protein
MSNIFRANRLLLSDPPSAILKGMYVKIPPDKLTQISHDFGDEFEPPQLDKDLVRSLFLKGAEIGYANDSSDDYALDRWLAPRVHAAIRLPRRITSDRTFWAWIAMALAPEYVFRRWESGGKLNSWRLTGELLRNGVSRLWWAAELLRNGPDYSAVDLGLKHVRTAQFALELKYSWYRPAAIAFVRVAEGKPRATDEQMTALSKRANAYLPLAPLEAIGFDDSEDELDSTWWGGCATLSELISDDPPLGPEDGYASKEAIESLEKWFQGILSESGGP